MKISMFRNIATAALAVVSVMACNPLNKMEKNAKTATYQASPNPLEMHGDKVKVTITGKIPTKYLARKAAVKVTPVFEVNGEVTKTLEPFVLVGEDSDFDGQKISFDNGGSFTYDYTYNYEPSMERGVLKAKLTGMFKTKTKEIGTFEIAKGTNITPSLVQSDEKPILGKDNFQRIVPFTQKAEILFSIQSSNVRAAELNKVEIKDLLTTIKEKSIDSTVIFKGLDVEAYASPDGELSINENLANNRAKSAAKVVKKQLKRYKIKEEDTDNFYNLQGKGEDWAGFKAKMQASDIEDKQLIIRVLEMYEDPQKREVEIKNLAETYTEVKEKILPPLRRSQITLRMEKVGLSDNQIANYAANDPGKLNVEELLYAATLTNDLNEKLRIYTKAAQLHPSDWRPANNVGYILLLQNKIDEAETSFNKAKSINATPVVMNNIGVIASLKNNRDAARNAYKQATGAGNEVSYNLGILDIKDGEYASAVSHLEKYKTLNLALAQILNGDYDGALATIDATEDKTTPQAYYLKAIVGARKGKGDMVLKNLKQAINKDASLKNKAMKDVEFINIDLSNL